MALTVPLSEIVERSNNRLLGKHESWGRVLLGEIATVVNGFAFKSSEFSNSGGVPLIRIRDVGKDRSETSYLGEYDSRYVVEPGDLLVGMDGDFNCARWRGPRGLLNQRVCKITVNSNIYLPRFLDYTLPGYLKAINDVTSSVTVKHLSSKSIEEIPLPLPPIEVQQRLVAEIEKQFSRLDEAVANLKRVKANLKRYKAGVLKAAVEGKLTEDWRKQHPNVEPASKLLERILAERRIKWKGKYKEPVVPVISALPLLPEGWTWAVVDQLGVVQLGRQRSPKNRSKDHPVQYLRAANITEAGLDLSDLLDMEFSLEEQKRYRLKSGDLVLSEASGSPNQVGKPAVWRDQLPLCCFQNTVIRLRPSGDLSPYLLACFKSYYVNGVFSNVASGVGINHLSADKFSKVAVPLPPVAEQSQIVAEVERRLSVIDELETVVESNLKRAKGLSYSILQRAFSGCLVPEDSNASQGPVSLEPIRIESTLDQLPKNQGQRDTGIKEWKEVMANLIEALEHASGWVSAQEVFRLCGVGGGAQTDAIEMIYTELRDCIHSGRIVIDRRGEEDWLCLSERRGA